MAVALQAETTAANSITVRWGQPMRSPQTNIKEPESAPSFFPEDSAETPRYIGNTLVEAVIENALTEPTAATLNMVEGSRRVNAVIGEILSDSVVVHCFIDAKSIDINLPPSLFPPEVLNYGAPVHVSLDTRGGIRTPVIEPRSISEQPKLQGQEAIEEWLRTR